MNFYFKKIKINDISLEKLQDLTNKIIFTNKTAYYCLTDVGNVMMAQTDPLLTKAINKSTLSIADGTPLVWFGKLIGRTYVERVSGVDLFQQFLHKTNYRHFLLGDTIQMQRKVIKKAKENKPDIQIEGYSPPFKPEFTATDNEEMFDKIHKADPDIIWVSFGGGKQEKWMLQNLSKLDRGVMIGVGAAFKFYTGELIIPPKIIQRLGLQWMSRLKDNPKRWITNGQFKFRILFSLNFPFEFAKAKRSISLDDNF